MFVYQMQTKKRDKGLFYSYGIKPSRRFHHSPFTIILSQFLMPASRPSPQNFSGPAACHQNRKGLYTRPKECFHGLVRRCVSHTVLKSKTKRTTFRSPRCPNNTSNYWVVAGCIANAIKSIAPEKPTYRLCKFSIHNNS